MPDPNDALRRAKEHLEYAYSYEEDSDLKTALYECESAIELIEGAFNIDDESASEARGVIVEAHTLRGELLEQMGKINEAIIAYETALNIDPEFEDALEGVEGLRQSERQGSRLVTIASFSQGLEAHIVRGRLEASGIPAFVANELTVTANWLYSNVVGGVQVQVWQEDAEEALEVLRSQPASDEDEQAQPEISAKPTLICPNCDSSRVHFEKYNRRLVFAAWALLGFPLPIMRERWKCDTCGHQWKIEEEEDERPDQ